MISISFLNILCPIEVHYWYTIYTKDVKGMVWFDLVWFMVLNATFNNISVISWRSVLLVEETGVPAENHRPVASY